jgi:hypothetical protein
MTSTAIPLQPLEVLVPPLYLARHRTASLNRESGERSTGARTRSQRPPAKPIIPSTPMTPAIQATRTHNLQSDESHGQRLSRLRLATSDGLAPSCRLRRLASRLTTRSPRLITDVSRHWSMTSSTVCLADFLETFCGNGGSTSCRVSGMALPWLPQTHQDRGYNVQS